MEFLRGRVADADHDGRKPSRTAGWGMGLILYGRLTFGLSPLRFPVFDHAFRILALLGR